MFFHVINKQTGEVMEAHGFWALSESGALYDILDGWGCEGGGGSSSAPGQAIVVMGPAPLTVEIKAQPVQAKPFKCDICGKNFTTESGLFQHIADKHTNR